MHSDFSNFKTSAFSKHFFSREQSPKDGISCRREFAKLHFSQMFVGRAPASYLKDWKLLLGIPELKNGVSIILKSALGDHGHLNIIFIQNWALVNKAEIDLQFINELFLMTVLSPHFEKKLKQNITKLIILIVSSGFDLL